MRDGSIDEMFSASKLLLVLALLHCSAHYGLSQGLVVCDKVANQPGCVCDLPDGSGRIDLTPLSDDGTPRCAVVYEFSVVWQALEYVVPSCDI